MKKVLFTAMLLCGVLYANAQLQVATLTHNNETTTFYGTDALVKANAVAEHGDVINLSAGMFIAPSKIIKALSIRGVGSFGSQTTIIEGTLSFEVPLDEKTNNIKLEGLYIEGSYHDYSIKSFKNFNNATILKCRFSDLSIGDNVSDTTYFDNVQLINNLIIQRDTYNSIIGNGTKTRGNINFYNCIISRTTTSSNSAYSFIGSSAASTINLTNCIYNSGNAKLYTSDKRCIFFTNSIIAQFGTNELNNVYGTNCILISQKLSPNQDLDYKKAYTNYSDIFKTFTGTYSEDETFELTDEAKQFLGTDGKEVGIYGGAMPFNANPTYPRITKLDVGSETTADGKLSVDIEVKSMNE